MRYHWPGNIRELRNLIERLVIVSDTDAILPIQILSHKTAFLSTPATETGFSITEGEDYSDALSKFEKAYIEHMIDICGGNVTKAAERMGIHKSVVYRKTHIIEGGSRATGHCGNYAVFSEPEHLEYMPPCG